MNIKKGDNVKVLAGKDRGKTGAVIKVFPEIERVTIEGVNVFAKRTRPKRQNQKGEIVHLPRPIHASNVMIVCPNCKKTVRVGRRSDGERSVRYCKKCEAAL